MHPNVLPVVERGARPGLPRVVAVVDQHPAGRDRAADPRRRPADPLAKPHVPTVCNTMWALTDFTEANGATRVDPRFAPRRPLTRLRRALRIDPGRDAEGQRARLARQPVARRRCELDRRNGGSGIAMNYCAGLDPPAGEPAARYPARDRGRLLASSARSSAGTASTTGSSDTSTSATRSRCSATPPRPGWSGTTSEWSPRSTTASRRRRMSTGGTATPAASCTTCSRRISLAANGASRSRILDAGCGPGGNGAWLATLRRRGRRRPRARRARLRTRAPARDPACASEHRGACHSPTAPSTSASRSRSSPVCATISQPSRELAAW